MSFEIEAPVVQLLKNKDVPNSSDILETTDVWFAYTTKVNEKVNFTILAGGGYNFIKKDGQYRIEPTFKFKI